MQGHTLPGGQATGTGLLTLSREGAVQKPVLLAPDPWQVFGLRGLDHLIRPCVATSRRMPVSSCHARSPIPLRVSSGFSPDSRYQSAYGNHALTELVTQ